MTGQDSWYLQTSNCKGMRLLTDSLSWINLNLIKGVHVKITVMLWWEKLNIFAVQSFNLNEVKSESTERRCPVHVYFTVYTFDSSLLVVLVVAIHYIGSLLGVSREQSRILSVWLNSPGHTLALLSSNKNILGFSQI